MWMLVEGWFVEWCLCIDQVEEYEWFDYFVYVGWVDYVDDWFVCVVVCVEYDMMVGDGG